MEDLAYNLADEIEALGGMTYVGYPQMAGDQWTLEIFTIAEVRALRNQQYAKSRANIDATRSKLIEEFDARGIDFVEVESALMPMIVGSGSFALH